MGVPPGNILCTENGQDDSRCGWGGEEVTCRDGPRRVRTLGQRAPREENFGERTGPQVVAPASLPYAPPFFFL